MRIAWPLFSNEFRDPECPTLARRSPLHDDVLLRSWIVRIVMGALVVFTALVSVGLTAPADSPFTIAVRPVVVRLGVDVDVKVGSAHLHLGWSALPTS